MPEMVDLERRVRRARRHRLFDPGELETTEITAGGIEQTLPHRGPMLLLDTIVGLDLTGRRGVGKRTLAPDDRGFDGHFPGRPVYPGVLQVEMSGQLGLFVACRALQQEQGSSTPPQTSLIRVREAVFVGEARPGMHLTALAEVLEDDGYTLSCIGQVLHDDSVLSVALFDAVISEAEAQ